jgi:hypothetical protein
MVCSAASNAQRMVRSSQQRSDRHSGQSRSRRECNIADIEVIKNYSFGLGETWKKTFEDAYGISFNEIKDEDLPMKFYLALNRRASVTQHYRGPWWWCLARLRGILGGSAKSPPSPSPAVTTGYWPSRCPLTSVGLRHSLCVCRPCPLGEYLGAPSGQVDNKSWGKSIHASKLTRVQVSMYPSTFMTFRTWQQLNCCLQSHFSWWFSSVFAHSSSSILATVSKRKFKFKNDFTLSKFENAYSES